MNKLKKIFIIGFASVLTIGLIACGKKNNEHAHEFSDWEIVLNPTCTEEGKKERECKCGEKEEETILALGHDVSENWTKDEKGHWHECSRCEEIFDFEEHVFTEWSIIEEPTYTKEGTKERKCSVCNYIQKENIEVLPKEDNNFTLNTISKVYDGSSISLIKGVDYTLPADYTGTELVEFYLDTSLQTKATEVKDVGTYYVVATLSQTDKYKEYTSQPLAFEITKKELNSVILSVPYSETGSGTILAGRTLALDHLQGIVEGDSVEIIISGNNLESWKANSIIKLVPIVTGNGEEQVKLKGKDYKNYIFVSGELTITKGLNSWIVEPSIESYNYGSMVAPKGFARFGTLKFEYKLATMDDNTYTLQKPLDVGNYTMRASVEETENYVSLIKMVDFTISQSENDWKELPGIDDWIYSSPSIPYGEVKFGTLKFEYKLAGSEDSTYTTTQPINAGNYIMRASVEETTNYKAISKIINFTIEKKTLNNFNIVEQNTLTYDSESKLYYLDVILEVTNSSINEGDEVKVRIFVDHILQVDEEVELVSSWEQNNYQGLIEIIAGKDMNNYRLDTFNLGKLVS